MKRQEAIAQFLKYNCKKVFPQYQEGMEVHVKVAQDLGEPLGKGFTDSHETWYDFRIGSIIDEERRINFDSKHFEAVGMSGWDFLNKKSHWVGFDFDSIIGHKKGLSDDVINNIIDRAKSCKFITIKKSTSGKGIHLYIPISNSPIVESRKHHILLARYILSTISGLLNFDFKSKVDTSGTILWIWHRKGNKPESFELVKEATEPFSNFSPNWCEEKKEPKIKELAANLKNSDLDLEQKQLLDWLSNSKYTWWWDAELNMLVCHTYCLKEAHTVLNLKGIFETSATGKDLPNDQNCFMFPLRNGAWIVRRHGIGTKEHNYWKSDKSGWTYCYYNKVPTLEDIASIYGGQLSPKKEYIFDDNKKVRDILKILSPSSEFELPVWTVNRQFKIKYLGDGKISVVFDRMENEHAAGWIENRKTFEKVFSIIEEEVEIRTPDELIRHVVGGSSDAGWYIYSRNDWNKEPLNHVSLALSTLGYVPSMVTDILGKCILNPYLLINKPFEPEYPGNREWNRFAPQLMYEPKEGDFSKWKLILEHLGQNLNEPVKNDSWCNMYGVKTGADYLKLWIASMFQYPNEGLPYLFFYGPQMSGKSTFHQAISLLVTKGVIMADTALQDPRRFNAELAGAILCAVEEIDLSKSKVAYDRIKEWVTADYISIHEKRGTPYLLNNTTHWVQCANASSYCPVSIGDTRIVMIYVPKPSFVLPKESFKADLKEQASAFLHEILNCNLPPPTDRLRLPVLETSEKVEEQFATANLVEQFILNNVYMRDGHYIRFDDFATQFYLWIGNQGVNTHEWSKIKISRAIPLTENMPIKGRFGGEGGIILANCSFNKADTNEDFKYIKVGERILDPRDK